MATIEKSVQTFSEHIENVKVVGLRIERKIEDEDYDSRCLQCSQCPPFSDQVTAICKQRSLMSSLAGVHKHSLQCFHGDLSTGVGHH